MTERLADGIPGLLPEIENVHSGRSITVIRASPPLHRMPYRTACAFRPCSQTVSSVITLTGRQYIKPRRTMRHSRLLLEK